MTDEEFKREVQDLVDMLNLLRLIKDKSRKRWLKVEIRNQLRLLLKDWQKTLLKLRRVLNRPTMKETENEKKTDPVLSKIKFMERTDLLRILNGAYIAERFFGKSGSWFSQKLNNNIKNGKPCEFTPEELITLSNALHTIAIELQDLADDLH